MLILGEVAMFSGQISEAERLLTEAEALLTKAEASAGRVLALERLAEIALSSGRNWHAKRLIRAGRGHRRDLLARAAPADPAEGPVRAAAGVER